MTRLRKAASAVAVGLGLLCGNVAQATSTDGYHSMQIIPIAVQTTSFGTSFFFHNPSAAAFNISVTYYPGSGTSTPGAVNCGVKVLNPGVTTYASLTALCPGITAGSNFGWLWTYELSAANEPYAVFTRVDNPQAQGFEVESFPPHTFNATNMHVLGLKRTAAAPGATTNCFIGAVQEPTTLEVSLWTAGNVQIGVTQSYALLANEFRRLSDIFATVGAPAGDYSNVRMRVVENQGVTEPGAIAFCTVQNNTTFDADFRIGKAWGRFGGTSEVQDDHVRRTLTRSTNRDGSNFTIGTYFSADRNRHTVYFKHPDWVQCNVFRTDAGALADLEMRLLAEDGTTVIAGGGDVQSFGEVYLGAKSTRGTGANTVYFIDVEGAAAASQGATYGITCQSGSGAVGLDIEQRGLADAF